MKLKLFALALATTLITTGCQTLNSKSQFSTKTQIFKLAEAKTYEANFEVTEGKGEDAIVIARPKIIFRAGQPAKMQVEGPDRVLTAEAYVSAEGDDPVCLCKVRIRSGGKFIYHHSEIISPKPKQP